VSSFTDLLSLKIERAAKHIQAIKNAIATDAARHGDAFIVESDGKEAVDLPEPDPEIAIDAGEFIYQMRSSLDHLAFDLVKRNKSGIALPAGWEDDCKFPIWTKPLEPGKTPPLPYGVFKYLPGIPHQSHAIIESSQPYYPRNTGSVNNCLRFLNNLSNIDKHRRLALTRSRGKVSHRVMYKSGITGSSLVTLDQGAEVPPPYEGKNDPIVEVKRNATLTVSFAEQDALGDATSVPLEYLLELIFADVLNVIDKLRPFLN